MKKIGVIGVPGGWSSDHLAATVEKKTGFSLLVDPGRMTLDLEQERVLCDGRDLMELDGFIIKKLGPSYSPLLLARLEILQFMAGRGMPSFSHPGHIQRLVDRLSCTVQLRLAGIPMPATTITEDVGKALEAVEKYGRAIFKPLFTSKARGMAVIDPGPEARQRIEGFQSMGNPIMYIQQMVSHPGMDMGVAFLGGEYLATYARAGNANSWHTTTRSGGRYEAYEPSREIIELAKKAQDIFGLEFTGVDVVETDHGPLVFEVSAFGGFRGLREANSIDAAELYVDHVLRKLTS